MQKAQYKNFLIQTQSWYAFQMLASKTDDQTFTCSPAFVEKVVALRSGKGVLQLTLILAIHALKAKRLTMDLRVSMHREDHIIGTWKDEQGTLRTVILSEISLGWIRQHCPEFAIRFGNRVFDGFGFSELDCSGYLDWHFGDTIEKILRGVGPDDAPNRPLAMPRETMKSSWFDGKYQGMDAYLIPRGYLPRQHEEKWHVFEQDGRLRFHRSWTGIAIFDVEMQYVRDDLFLGSFYVNRIPSNYGAAEATHDRAMLEYLINVLLLRKPADFPSESRGDSANALEQWSAVGINGI